MTRHDHFNSMKEHKNSKFILSLAEVQIGEQELSAIPFQVLRVGEFYDKRYGKFSITEQMLRELKENFDNRVLEIDVALDTNHEPEMGAKAWVDRLEIREGGLWATFKDFTAEAQKYFKEKIFKYFSVEFAPFTKVQDGKKLTFQNVLRGIALTNRPVIKGMQPTFLSEDIEITHKNNDMNVVKLFAEQLLQRDSVTKDDVNSLKLMFASLSEEAQTEAKESVESVEEKLDAQTEEKKEEEEKKEDAPGAGAELSEVKTELAEANRKLSELEAKENARVFADRTATLMLSEKNLTGFPAKLSEKVKGFVAKLSDAEFAEFKELVSSTQVIEAGMFEESGSGEEGEPADGDDTNGDATDKAAKELAEKEKISYKEALIRVSAK